MSGSLVYERLDGKCAEYLKKYFTSFFRTGYVRCKGFVLPKYFENFGDRIRRMEVRPDDVWVCSVPKSGESHSLERWKDGVNASSANQNKNGTINLNISRYNMGSRSGLVHRKQRRSGNGEEMHVRGEISIFRVSFLSFSLKSSSVKNNQIHTYLISMLLQIANSC